MSGLGRAEGVTDSSASQEERRLRAALLLLLALFVGLRVLLALRSPIHLFNGEEFVHLRLFHQLSAGLPVGELGQYAYGDGRGINGGGSVVLSLLYLALAPVLGSGALAVRTMALLWTLAGAVLAIGLGRRLLGPRGGLACLLLLLCMPPSFTVHGLVAWGNHSEGGTLVLLVFWVFLRALDSTAGRRAMAWAGGLGFLLGFVPWFWPLAAIPASLLLVPALRRLPGGARPRGTLILGLALGLAPWFLVTLDSSHVEHSGGLGTALAALGATLANPKVLWQTLVAGFGSVPVYDVAWAGRWTPPAWLEGPGASLFRLVAWVCVLSMLAALPRGRKDQGSPKSPTPAATVRRVAAATALLIPLALVVADAVAPRRMTAVYPLWALALAAPLRRLVLPGRARWRWAVVVLLPILGLSPSVLLALSGPAPSQPFEPNRYALCPAELPVLGGGTCVRDLSERHLPLLHRADRDERLADPARRKAALRGFDAATGTASDFALRRLLAPCPERAVRIPEMSVGPDAVAVAWEYFGAALAVSCSPDEAAVRCREVAPPGQLEHCEAGVLWTRQRTELVPAQ